MRRRIRVMLIEGDGTEHTAITSNLSQTGISLASRLSLAPGTPLTGRLFPPEVKAVAFAAEVRWAHVADSPRNEAERYRLGLVFLGPPQDGYATLIGVRPRTLRPVATPVPVVAAPKASRARRGGSSRQPRLTPTRSAVAGLEPGRDAKVTRIVEVQDLAVPPSIGPSSLSPLRAANWIERAALEAIGGLLPQGVATMPTAMEIVVAAQETVGVGSCVVTHVQIVEVGPSGHWLRFEATLKDGARQLARGAQLRQVVQVAKK